MRKVAEVERKRYFLWNGMIGIKTPWGVSGERTGKVAGERFRQMLNLN